MKNLIGASMLALSVATPAHADTAHSGETPPEHSEIVVTGTHEADRIDLPPATRITVTAQDISTKINAVSAEDTLKYAPSLVIRKRHIGDNFAPIATRTSGLGASARSLIYADGVLLSAFIANNNGNGSPRWTLVTPEEIARVDVLYGPFSAAYPGNGIGTTVNITTRLPDKLEASARVLTNVQDFSLYGTNQTLPTYQFAASAGDRFGPLALFAAFTRTDALSQPLSIVTLAGTANPTGTTGGYADVNRTGGAIRVLGAGGLEHHLQNTAKFKAALDLGGSTRLTYLLGIWTDDTTGTVQSYLTDSAGTVSYKTANNGSTAGFNSAVYTRAAHHTAHALTFEGSSHHFDWHLVGTSYHYDHDLQNTPTAVLPGGFTGGAGTIQRQDGTGWVTLEAKAAWRPAGDESHVISFGAHGDRYVLNTNTYGAANWLDTGTQGQVSATSQGRARTLALWAQDALQLTPALTLTLGGRQEWWRAWGGFNLVASGASLVQPDRRFTGFSPKAALEWRPAPHLTARFSLGQAWRFPTVGELYQQTTVGTQIANPNPGLRPERARSAELAIEHRDDHGSLRAALFNEVIDDALIAQTGTVAGTSQSASFVQNVDRTRARGIELAANRRDVLPRLDVSASVTYADAITAKNTVFPASVGKLLPSVPHWKANAVITWRPSEVVSLTGAMRMASRNYATLDNSDTVGNTYQGFDKYVVFDARAQFHVAEHFEFAVGVDNLTNDKYFLFHPFPQRSFTAEVRVHY